MNTVIQKSHFFRLKAAMSDLIDRAGGIERAADLCGYSKSAVGRWHCRNNDDLMPMAAVIALECETNSFFVTQAMCGIHGLSTSPAASEGSHVLGAYVALNRAASDLSATIGEVIKDGVVTVAENQTLDGAAADVCNAGEHLRGALAAAGGKALKVVG